MYRKSVILFLCLMLVLPFASLNAQGVQTLTPGTFTIATITQEAPLNIFAFAGNAGDLLYVQLTPLQPNMNLGVSLQSPAQVPLGVSSRDFSDNIATLNARLDSAGTYSLLVGGNAGDYVISLNVMSVANAPTLSSDQPQNAALNTTDAQIFNFNNQTANPIGLSLSTSANSLYNLSVYGGNGAVIGSASNLPAACFGIAPSAAPYSVIVTSTNAQSTESVNLSLVAGCGSSGSTAAPQATQPVVVNPPTDPSVCSASSNGSVNIRNGAGTEFGIIGQLVPGAPLRVTGATNNGWVQVQTAAGAGFVSQSVVNLSGTCNNLPLVGGGQGQPTAVVPTVGAPTIAPTQGQGEPTPTMDVVQPTVAAPTETPTQAANIAPPDNNYSLNVPLDGNLTLSDYVSFPNGDVEDLVSYSVTGLNPTTALPGGQADLTFALSCSGTGTEHIVFTISGQQRTCGQTFTRRVNFDSNTGAIRVTATGGSGTYVQWTVIAAAPRVN